MKTYEWSPLFMADSGPGGSGPSNPTGQGTNGFGTMGGPGGPGGNSTSGAPGSTGGSSSHGGPQNLPPAAPEAPEETAEEKAAREAAAAEEFAKTQAGIAAQGAGRESAGYARAQGMNPAQAALLSGQTAGNVYGGAYGTGLYNKLGLDMQKYGIDKNYKMQQNQLDQQNMNNLFSGIGTGLSAAALLFSDKDLKEDIKDGYGILDRVTKAVGPKTFRMKGDGETQVGVMAQDLEKTPLASTVVDTPEGKMVDTRKLTTANTAMLSDLSKKVDTLYSFLREASNGPARAS